MRVAPTVNSTTALLYWEIGKRIQGDILRNERAKYGEEILSTLSAKLTPEYGNGFGEKSLRHMIRFVEVFPDNKIVSALQIQLA